MLLPSPVIVIQLHILLNSAKIPKQLIVIQPLALHFTSTEVLSWNMEYHVYDCTILTCTAFYTQSIAWQYNI